MEDTWSGIFFRDSKDNIFLYNDKGDLTMWYNNIIMTIDSYYIWDAWPINNRRDRTDTVYTYNDMETLEIEIKEYITRRNLEIIKYETKSEFIVYMDINGICNLVDPYNTRNFKLEDKFIIFERDLDKFEDKIKDCGFTLTHEKFDANNSHSSSIYYNVIMSNRNMCLLCEVK